MSERLENAVRDWMQFGAGDGTESAEAESDRLLRNIAAAFAALPATPPASESRNVNDNPIRPASDPLRGSDISMAEHSDTRSHCPRCGEWRDSPTADCAACGYTPPASETVEAARRNLLDYAFGIHGPKFVDAFEAAIRAEADDPTMDGTDGAHPAWWRGSDYGYAKGRAEADERVAVMRRIADIGARYRIGTRGDTLTVHEAVRQMEHEARAALDALRERSGE